MKSFRINIPAFIIKIAISFSVPVVPIINHWYQFGNFSWSVTAVASINVVMLLILISLIQQVQLINSQIWSTVRTVIELERKSLDKIWSTPTTPPGGILGSAFSNYAEKTLKHAENSLIDKEK